jgi:aryl-alcohol dehydrogenase-like predicted oxidoreductase
MPHDTRPLGRTGIHVLPLGIGTNKWRRADRGAVLETYRTIHDAGPCMIDTAEIYFSESVVGDCLRAGPTRAVIASKFIPFPGRTSPRRLMSPLDGSLARLGLETIDLYYGRYTASVRRRAVNWACFCRQAEVGDSPKPSKDGGYDQRVHA